MDGVKLLTRAKQAGLSVTLDGDKLVVRGPASAGDLARALLARKAEILALLTTPDAPAPEPVATPAPAENSRQTFDSISPPAPDGFVTAADGTRIPVFLHKCSDCGQANWGPRPGSDAWWCLTCHPTPVKSSRCPGTGRWRTAGDLPVCGSCGSVELVERDGVWFCAICDARRGRFGAPCACEERWQWPTTTGWICSWCFAEQQDTFSIGKGHDKS